MSVMTIRRARNAILVNEPLRIERAQACFRDPRRKDLVTVGFET